MTQQYAVSDPSIARAAAIVVGVLEARDYASGTMALVLALEICEKLSCAPLITLPLEAGSPEIEITPAMIEAGERVIFASGVWPNECYGDWSSDLAMQVYRAMACAALAKP